MIDVLEIQEKQKLYPRGVASPDDFAWRKVGEADSSLVVTDPTISLYCLDHDARCALFVQVPEEVDITVAAFTPMAQYDCARRLLAVPYDTFHRLAADIHRPASLVFIHSTGRAGSTLLSKVFAEMESATSLSEPGVYTQAVAMRLSGNDDEIADLLASATKILLNPTFTHGSSLNVLKFDSFSTELADLLSAAFPDARTLFLYRDLGAYLQSALRAFAMDAVPPLVVRVITASLATMSPLLSEELERREEMDSIEVQCLIWLSAMHAYTRMQQRGIPMLAVRYEELIADPSRVLATILDFLGLPIDGIQRGLRAFARDSQADSPLSREAVAANAVEIDSGRWELVRDLVRRYPVTGADIPALGLLVP
jgi:Sulfotransferase family